MICRKIATIASGLAIALAANCALGQQTGGPTDTLRVTIGVKAWDNTWETWLNTSGTQLASATSNSRWALIPNISLNYGNFFGSAGYFTKTGYGFPSANTFDFFFGTLPINQFNVKRDEYDLSAGYWLLRGDTGGRLGATLGYKQVNQYFSFTGNSFKETIKGGTVGLVGSAPIAGSWSLYASGAVGPARERFLNLQYKGYYASGEAGVAYGIARNTTLTAGYKGQVIDVGVNGQRARDTTNGIIVGISYTF